MACLWNLCFLSSIFVVTSYESSNDDTKSLIYTYQHRYCGGLFCNPDPSHQPPTCPKSTQTPHLENVTGSRQRTYETTTRDALKVTADESRCDPCCECSCDDACVLSGNCCADKYIGGEYFFDCEKISIYRNGESEYSFYEIVSKCLQDSPNYSPDLAEKCNNGEIGYIQDGRLVLADHPHYNTTVTLRNKYCAMCYNISNYTPWDVYITCNEDFDPSNYSDINSLIRSVKESRACFVSYLASEDQMPPMCMTMTDMISTCNETGRWQKYNESMEIACHSYFNPTRTWKYKNIFCHLCNGESQDELECPTQCHYGVVKPVIIMPFAALLNFEKSDAEVLKGENSKYQIRRIGNQVKHQCREGDMYDAYSKTCREIYCPLTGEKDNTTCTDLTSSEQLVLTLWNATAYYDEIIVSFWKETPIFGNIVVAALTSRSKGFGFFPLSVRTGDFAVINSPTTLSIQESQLELKLFLLPEFSLEQARERLMGDIKLNITWMGNPIFVNIVSEYKNISDKLLTKPQTSFKAIHPQMRNIDMSKAIEVPLAFNASCPMIRFGSNEVDVENGMAIIHGRARTENEYVTTQTGDYFICLGDLSRGDDHVNKLLRSTKSSDFLPGQIITGICLSCSLLFLLITSLVYILIKELQSVPGLNLILLTTSLFVAQVLYLFGAGTVTTPTICTVIGVLIHYFWLVAFAWMNVCCLHMFRVFTSLFSSLSFADSKTSVVLKYSAFAYGTPVIVVGATLVTTYIASGYKRVAYGGTILCFVAPGLVSIISFGIPAGLTVLANAVFLIIATLYLKRASNKSNRLRKSESNDISKFFKLSTITGLSWVFGFLGYFLQRVEFLYVFTILTAGQGVFIFLSFVASRRILALMRVRFNCLQCQGESKQKYLKDATSENQRSSTSVSQTSMISKL